MKKETKKKAIMKLMSSWIARCGSKAVGCLASEKYSNEIPLGFGLAVMASMM